MELSTSYFDKGQPVLQLSIRVAPTREQEFLEYLREALPTYEERPGIRFRLLRNRDDPELFIEQIEYDDWATYHWDQDRTEREPVANLLKRWRALLRGPARVATVVDVTFLIRDDQTNA